MTRGAQTKPYRAVSEPEFRDQMHALPRKKYGFADWRVRLFKDLSEAIPVRLEPASAQPEKGAV
jgi:hypothetical protein